MYCTILQCDPVFRFALWAPHVSLTLPTTRFCILSPPSTQSCQLLLIFGTIVVSDCLLGNWMCHAVRVCLPSCYVALTGSTMHIFFLTL